MNATKGVNIMKAVEREIPRNLAGAAIKYAGTNWIENKDS
jgi:hypothetical protein